MKDFTRQGPDVGSPVPADFSLIPNPPEGKAHIFATGGPGNGFGQAGEGYIRFSLCVPEDKIREALKRLEPVRMEPGNLKNTKG